MPGFLETIDLDSPIAGVFPAARVGATEAALDLLEVLSRKHGRLSLHHAGPCVDGEEPICPRAGELRTTGDDRLLGEIDGTPVYVSGPHVDYWSDRQFILDAAKGHSTGFSLAGGSGWRFVTRARLFDEEDRAALGLPVGKPA